MFLDVDDFLSHQEHGGNFTVHFGRVQAENYLSSVDPYGSLGDSVTRSLFDELVIDQMSVLSALVSVSSFE